MVSRAGDLSSPNSSTVSAVWSLQILPWHAYKHKRECVWHNTDGEVAKHRLTSKKVHVHTGPLALESQILYSKGNSVCTVYIFSSKFTGALLQIVAASNKIK